MKIWVTGTTGFITSHDVIRLLGRGDEVVRFESFNDYCDVNPDVDDAEAHVSQPFAAVGYHSSRVAARQGVRRHVRECQQWCGQPR